MKVAPIILIVVACLTSVSADAKAPRRERPFPHGPYGYTAEEFAKQCRRCEDYANEIGRSVGGFCPGACVEVDSIDSCYNEQKGCPPPPKKPSSPPH